MLKGHICTKSWGLWTIVQINPESEQAPKLSKLQKPPQTQKVPYVPLPHPVISLYLVIESSLCSFNHWLNRSVKSSAFASKSSMSPSPSTTVAAFSSLTVAGRRVFTMSASPKRVKVDLFIFLASLGGGRRCASVVKSKKSILLFVFVFFFLFFNFLNFLNFETVVESNKNYKLRTSKSTGNLQGRVLAIVNQWVQE